jgi:hypothetical protein
MTLFYFKEVRNNMKRMILCCCVAALLVSCEPEVNYEYEDVEKPVYNGEILYGTPIASLDELKKIGSDEDYPLSGYYDLTDDIDLGGDPWTPLGPDAATPFTGFLNGNNKTISGLVLQAGEDGEQVYTGLFGYLSFARVTNLTLELANEFDTEIKLTKTGTATAAAQYIGALAGYMANSRIADITVRAGAGKGLNITKSTGNFYVGGVIGRANANDQIQKISADLSLTVEAEGTTYAGGIIGSSASTGVLQDCTISGAVEVSSSAAVYAGGIVGDATGGTLVNCAGVDIRVSGETSGNTLSYAGGIAGSAWVTNSTVTGTGSDKTLIQAKATNTASNRAVFAGGISGSGTITGSSVTGTVEIRAESSGPQPTAAGGIGGGYSNVTTSYTLEGVQVLVKANNETTVTTPNIIVAAGGIAGTAYEISNCFSRSPVTLETAFGIIGGTGAGGLAGYFPNGNNTIENSYADGAVTIINSNTQNTVFAGGLAGVNLFSSYSGSINVKNSVALNPSVTVESANTDEDSVYIYRILGAAFNGTTSEPFDDPENEKIILLNNYASETMETKKKTTGAEEWTDVDQGTNNTEGLSGDANLTLDESFFSGTLGWDFTTIWKWDNALNLPVLNS